MLKEAQEAVKSISGTSQKRTVETSAYFHSLIVEQVGQVARAYVHSGRKAEGIDESIADIIVCCLAYMNWLDVNASDAFKRALEKHRKAIAAKEAAE